jgi:hypothetical protein
MTDSARCTLLERYPIALERAGGDGLGAWHLTGPGGITVRGATTLRAGLDAMVVKLRANLTPDPLAGLPADDTAGLDWLERQPVRLTRCPYGFGVTLERRATMGRYLTAGTRYEWSTVRAAVADARAAGLPGTSAT